MKKAIQLLSLILLLLFFTGKLHSKTHAARCGQFLPSSRSKQTREVNPVTQGNGSPTLIGLHWFGWI